MGFPLLPESYHIYLHATVTEHTVTPIGNIQHFMQYSINDVIAKAISIFCVNNKTTNNGIVG